MARWIRAARPELASLVVSLAVAGSALAHGGRLPFDSWGGFTGDVLRCQRVIARAAARCASDAWAARRACRETALDGGVCDEAATTARIAEARRRSQDEVATACTERQASTLQFLGSFDLQQDLIDFCRDWERAADSAAFGALGTGNACASATAAAVSDVMQYALRSRRRCMDRVAASAGGAASRGPLLAGADRHLSRAVEQAALRLAARCPDFVSRSGRSPGDLLTTVAARADCVGGAFYIQDRVLCAPPLCGNGVVETNEDCDDGNTDDGDACPASCTR
ncbi:hypothetical protein KF840_12540 [bacterium]|nr:hypothetical protein [bacterium]